MKRILFSLLSLVFAISVMAVGRSGQYEWSVQLTGYISSETGKSPTAYLWIPEGCDKVKAVMLAQQNMTEEMLFKMPSFKEKLRQMGVGLIWIAPAFSQDWNPTSGCQQTFEELMPSIAYQANHPEIATCSVIPFGHSQSAKPCRSCAIQ